VEGLVFVPVEAPLFPNPAKLPSAFPPLGVGAAEPNKLAPVDVGGADGFAPNREEVPDDAPAWAC
jgi:hypothetical protein